MLRIVVLSLLLAFAGVAALAPGAAAYDPCSGGSIVHEIPMMCGDRTCTIDPEGGIRC